MKTEITACLKHNKIDNKSVESVNHFLVQVCQPNTKSGGWLDAFQKTIWHTGTHSLHVPKRGASKIGDGHLHS